MDKMARRPFLGTAIAGFPFALLGQSSNTSKLTEIPPYWAVRTGLANSTR